MRLFLILFAMLFAVVSCSEKTETTLLQEGAIALAQPRISATSSIIDSSVIVTADLRFDGVKIFYSKDGTEPTLNSIQYIKPFESSEEGVYKFKAFHPSWKSSEIAMLELYKKGIVPNEIKWYSSPNSTYKGLGLSTLINQEKAGLNFRDPQWVGFDSIAVADIYFGEKRLIKTIDVGYLVDAASWIFPPTSIKISSSEMETIEIEVPRLNQQAPRVLRNLNVNIGRELSTMRIEVRNLTKIPDWHDGKGNKAWLFMDEWIFK